MNWKHFRPIDRLFVGNCALEPGRGGKESWAQWQMVDDPSQHGQSLQPLAHKQSPADFRPGIRDGGPLTGSPWPRRVSAGVIVGFLFATELTPHLRKVEMFRNPVDIKEGGKGWDAINLHLTDILVRWAVDCFFLF